MVAGIFAAGCSSSSSGNSSNAPQDSGTTGQADTGGGPGTDSSAPGDSGVSPGTDSGSESDGGDAGSGGGGVSLPFFVSDQFIPSGFMNDPTGITLSAGANGGAACPDRAPTQGGSCYVIRWSSTGKPWAGVYWQYPANNWGTEPGLMVAPGATQVSFYAKGAAGGEIIQFKTGGINDPIVTATGNYGDTFAVTGPTATLSTTWTQYTISLTGATYPQGVLGAFVWVAAAVVTDAGTTNDDLTFYVDDLQWQ
jgi:hypothetical protein